MARVKSLLSGNQSAREHPSEVDCYWQVIGNQSEDKLLHLTTFGSANRASRPKSSQSLQVDAEFAQKLVDLLRRVFPTVQ